MDLRLVLLLGLVILAFVLLRGGAAPPPPPPPVVGGAAAPLDDDDTWDEGKGCLRGCGADHLICQRDLFSHNSAVPGCCNPEAAGGASYYCRAKPTSGLGLYCVPGDLCTSSGHSCRTDLFAANFGLSGCCVDGDAPTEACKDHTWFSP